MQEHHHAPIPTDVESKVDISGLGKITVGREVNVDNLPPEVEAEVRQQIADREATSATPVMKKQSKRKEFFKRIAGRPIKGEFNGINRAARREPVNQMNNYGNPKGMGKSRRNKNGDIIRAFGGGTPGARSVCGFRTQYAENERGLTPQDLERKRAYLAAKASAKAPAKARKARTKKTLA